MEMAQSSMARTSHRPMPRHGVEKARDLVDATPTLKQTKKYAVETKGTRCCNAARMRKGEMDAITEDKRGT